KPELPVEHGTHRFARAVMACNHDLASLPNLIDCADDAHCDVVVQAIHALDVGVSRQHLQPDLIPGVAIVPARHACYKLASRTISLQLGFEPLANCGGGFIAGWSFQET